MDVIYFEISFYLLEQQRFPNINSNSDISQTQPFSPEMTYRDPPKGVDFSPFHGTRRTYA